MRSALGSEFKTESEVVTQVGGVHAPTSMRAAVLAGPGLVRIVEVERPQPGPDQVRIRLEGCGVCASNPTPWAGPDWMRFPTEPGGLGHEGWGVVDAVGERVESLSVGNRESPSCPTRPMRTTTLPMRTRRLLCRTPWRVNRSRVSRSAAL